MRVCATIKQAALAVASLLCVICSSAEPVNSPVLLELFTSEGCSSCPPADALLAKWNRDGNVDGVPVICLGYHVDYWNNLGWKDEWSSCSYTDRQTEYNRALHYHSNYTPQLVVNGAAHVVGNNEREVRPIVAAAAKLPTIPMHISVATGSAMNAELTVGAAPAGAVPHPAILFAAIVQNAAQSDVKHGENSGKHLVHSAVVTNLLPISTSLQVGSVGARYAVKLPSIPLASHLVLFLQEPISRRILGATQVPAVQL